MTFKCSRHPDNLKQPETNENLQLIISDEDKKKLIEITRGMKGGYINIGGPLSDLALLEIELAMLLKENTNIIFATSGVLYFKNVFSEMIQLKKDGMICMHLNMFNYDLSVISTLRQKGFSNREIVDTVDYSITFRILKFIEDEMNNKKHIVMDILPIDEYIKDLVLSGASHNEISKCLSEKKVPALKDKIRHLYERQLISRNEFTKNLSQSTVPRLPG